MVDVYYTPLIALLFISFAVGLFYSASKAARYFAYAGITFYFLGLLIGVYCGR